MHVFIFWMKNGTFVFSLYVMLLAASSCTVWISVHPTGFHISSPGLFFISFLSFSSIFTAFLSPSIAIHQSIFMFPLSFSSSSSLSSIPPSLDSISEFDHGLSDISEDGDLIDDAATSHSPWSLPSLPSITSEQQSASFEHLSQNPQTSNTITAPQTCTTEVCGEEEICQSETRATSVWQRWFSFSGVFKYFSFILCFISLGKDRNVCHLTKLFSALNNKVRFLTVTGFKLMLKSAKILKIFRCIPSHLTSISVKINRFVTLCISHLRTKFNNLVPICTFHRKQLQLPIVGSFIGPLPSLSSPSCLPFSSYFYLPLNFLSLSSVSVHHYLLNPSPLFLPCLLVVFLLVVMLTASQSLVLALILAAPLGLTLCYLEKVVSSRQKAMLPLFITEGPCDQRDLSSGFSQQGSPFSQTHTPPRNRHHTHTGASWTQEMCDPAA